MSRCFVCSAPSKSRCGKCKAVPYCGSECQKKHWNCGHRELCGRPVVREQVRAVVVYEMDTLDGALDCIHRQGWAVLKIEGQVGEHLRALMRVWRAFFARESKVRNDLHPTINQQNTKKQTKRNKRPSQHTL